MREYLKPLIKQSIGLLVDSVSNNTHWMVMFNINPGKLNNEWIAGPEKKNSLESVIVDYPKHLKLRLAKIKKLISSKP